MPVLARQPDRTNRTIPKGILTPRGTYWLRKDILLNCLRFKQSLYAMSTFPVTVREYSPKRRCAVLLPEAEVDAKPRASPMFLPKVRIAANAFCRGLGHCALKAQNPFSHGQFDSALDDGTKLKKQSWSSLIGKFLHRYRGKCIIVRSIT